MKILGVTWIIVGLFGIAALSREIVTVFVSVSPESGDFVGGVFSVSFFFAAAGVGCLLMMGKEPGVLLMCCLSAIWFFYVVLFLSEFSRVLSEDVRMITFVTLIVPIGSLVLGGMQVWSARKELRDPEPPNGGRNDDSEGDGV